MSVIDGVRHRLRVLLRGEEYARDVEREFRFHLELAALANSGEFDDRLVTELAGRKALGNATYYREEVRQMTLLTWVDRIRQNATYAIRGLKRSPGFTATVVVTLALGFGVNAAMYSMLDQVFRRAPNGVPHPSGVRRLYKDLSRPREPSGHLVSYSFTYPHYRALVKAVTPVELAAFTAADSATMTDGASKVPARESRVTGNYFSVLGLRPRLGRFFIAEEDSIQTPTPVVVISSAFWIRAFGANPAVLGRSVLIDHQPFTIVGVAPKDFAGIDLDIVDIWLPANMYQSGSGMPGVWYEGFSNSFKLVARAPSTSDAAHILAVGPAAMRSVHFAQYEYDPNTKILLGSIVEADGPMQPAQEVSVATRIAWIAVIVLLIACANVINLLLLRAAKRKREIALRQALGASHSRLYEQLAVESTLLALLGGGVALVISAWIGSALRRLMLPRVHWATGVVDSHTVFFPLGLSLVIGLGAGLAPALLVARGNLAKSLKAGAREGTYQRSALRSSLLVIQSTLCIILLVGSGLFLRSLSNMKSISVGYEVDNLTFVWPVFASSGSHGEQLSATMPEAAARVSHIEGVEAVAYASVLPMMGMSADPVFLPDQDSLPHLGHEVAPSMSAVSPEYFRAAGIRIRDGRDFSPADLASSGVIVSETLARLYWPGTRAIGKCLIFVKRSNPCSAVVGVAADVHRAGIIEQPTLQYYTPVRQSDHAPQTLIVRTRPGRAVSAIREAQNILAQTIPGTDGSGVRRMADVLEPQLRPWRLGATLFTAFGLLAIAVAGIGIYSVVAYGVSQRTNEMGIRLALGASSRNILDLVVGEGIRLLGIGIALGVIASLALGRFIGSLLFGITPYDASVLIGAASILTALGLLACAIPAWRATRVDPVTALRAD